MGVQRRNAFIYFCYWPCLLTIFITLYYNIQFLLFRSWYHITIIFVIFVLFITSSNPVTVSSIFYQKNVVVLSSPLLIVIFCHFSLFPPRRQVRPLVRITDYIGSTLLSNNTIAIYHACFSPSTMDLYHRHHCLLLFLLFFFVTSQWMSATTYWDH